MGAILEQGKTLIEDLIFGGQPQLKKSDLEKITRRVPFSKYLNYSSYDHGLNIYINADCSLGMLWECIPVTFAGLKTITTLEGLFRANLPKNSILQFTLYADDHIDPYLSAFQASKIKDDPVVQESTKQIANFLSDGRKGLRACSGIQVRNFRLFVAVTIPGEEGPDPENFEDEEETMSIQDMQRQIIETLKSAQLAPRVVTPDILMEWLRRFFNTYPEGYPELNLGAYSDDIPLNKQIINADTVIKKHGSDCLQVGNNYLFIITPKTIPTPINPLQTNELFGGVWGPKCDMDQIKDKFIYTLSFVFEKGLEAEIHGKCNLFLNQKGSGSLAPMLQRKQDEYLSAVDAIDHGTRFVRVIPILTILCPNQKRGRESATRARRLWEDQGYVMQQETILTTVLFLSSLPFGMRVHNLKDLERDFIAPVNSITPLMPVQGDFRGTGIEPKLPFIGRKGQLIGFDIFAKGAINHNMLVAASSGSGKSFSINYLAFNYYACGALIRIIDIGGSYKKMANTLGAPYLDFAPGTDICLNPFTYIVHEDSTEELKAVSAVFAQMVYSNSDTEKCDDTEMNMIRKAVYWAWWKAGNDADSDLVHEYLENFPHRENEKRKVEFEEILREKELANTPLTEEDKIFIPYDATDALKDISTRLAFNMSEYTSQGSYKNYFIGKSTFDIKNDDFVVLELENLKVQMDLYRVVILLVINAVTQDLYLSDRSRPRLIIFEEAWQFLGKAAQLAPVVEEGYRRARKYHGSFSIVIQSPLDLHGFGYVGKVINGNAAFKIFLETTDFQKARDEGILDYDEFTMELVQSVKSNPPNYSELFFDTPFGYGVGRLIVNNYAYFVYTSNPKEIAKIESLVDQLVEHSLNEPGVASFCENNRKNLKELRKKCYHEVFTLLAGEREKGL
jgi:conjugal transfer ATP-binding protein TraC